MCFDYFLRRVSPCSGTGKKLAEEEAALKEVDEKLTSRPHTTVVEVVLPLRLDSVHADLAPHSHVCWLVCLYACMFVCPCIDAQHIAVAEWPLQVSVILSGAAIHELVFRWVARGKVDTVVVETGGGKNGQRWPSLRVYRSRHAGGQVHPPKDSKAW